MENIDKIMQPYYDKKEEINKLFNSNEVAEEKLKEEALIEEKIKTITVTINELKEKRELEKRKLEVQLEHLKDNKEREISEYIQEIYWPNSISSTHQMSQQSSHYMQMVKNDLEKAYKEREITLLNDIKSFDKQTDEELAAIKELDELNSKLNASKLNNVNDNESNRIYERVYKKELLNTEIMVRKDLLAKKDNLTIKLEEETKSFDKVMEELSEFKYEYNEQHQVINGYKWRELYDISSNHAEKMSSIKKAIQKIDNYLNEIEMNSEVPLIHLTQLEQIEYDRRNSDVDKKIELEKSINLDDIQEEKITSQINIVDDNKEDESLQAKSVIELVNDIDTKEDAVVYNATKEDNKIILDSYEDLLKMVYNNIINELESVKSVKLDAGKKYLNESEAYISEKGDNLNYRILGKIDLGNNEDSIELPSGEYVYDVDYDNAIEEYYQKQKGNTYIIKNLESELKITSGTLKKYKESLKKCSTIKLLHDNKISNIDMRRVFGKAKADEYNEEIKAKQLGKVYTYLPEGDYISRNDAIVSMSTLFKQKNKNWIKSILEKIHGLTSIDNSAYKDENNEEYQMQKIKNQG